MLAEDSDDDGIADAFSMYENGRLVFYGRDANQDGFEELAVYFDAEPENNFGEHNPAYAVIPCDGEQATVFWDQYPEVARTNLDGTVFFPATRSLYYAPLILQNAFGSANLLFATFNSNTPQLTRRLLVSGAVRLERPGTEFADTTERVEMRGGIPQRSEEYQGDKLIKKTEFYQGRPVVQYCDLDFDGRLETIRRFRENEEGLSELASSESDWDNDGAYEYKEIY
jgi:hypothetical protein